MTNTPDLSKLREGDEFECRIKGVVLRPADGDGEVCVRFSDGSEGCLFSAVAARGLYLDFTVTPAPRPIKVGDRVRVVSSVAEVRAIDEGWALLRFRDGSRGSRPLSALTLSDEADQ
jgi:hypothetical protein